MKSAGTHVWIAAACVTIAHQAAIQQCYSQDCPGWRELPPTGAAPAPREHHAAAFDPVRSRLVVYGGHDGVVEYFGDTWEFDGSSWALRATEAQGPGVREFPVLVYDNARGVVLMFGGDIRPDFIIMNDLWQWDGTAWTLLGTSGPPPVTYHAAAFDTTRGVLVTFGGFLEDGRRSGETWEWDGSGWLRKATTGPSPRIFHAMAYDPVRERTILHGGDVAGGYSSELWEWDGSTWVLRGNGGPTARAFSGFAYDGGLGATVLFGGNPGGAGNSDETWIWEGMGWRQQRIAGPSERHNPVLMPDSAGNRVLLFGGHDWKAVFSDVWELRTRAPCDVNCDGSVNGFDIQGFVEALVEPSAPGCSTCAADANADGSLNAFDIQPFVECLEG